MSHQDRTDQIVVNHQTIKQVADELLPPGLFRSMKARKDATWKPRMLALGALLLVTAGKETLSKGFGQSRTRSLEAAFSPRKKPPRTKQKTQRSSARTSKKGRSKAATKKSSKQKSKSKPKAQSAESIAKKANSPQMWLTLLWHVGSGLPWDWRTGPSDSSERGPSEEMLPKLPENSLIGLWCVCLLGEGELAADGNDPTRLSPAAAIAAFQDTVGDYRVRPERVEEHLWQRMRVALLDDYERSSAKASRNDPRKKQRDRISPPQITWATTQQTHAANQLKANATQQRLTA